MIRRDDLPARPRAGNFSVPLFNQKRRNRVPLTSVPSEHEFFSHSDYTATSSSSHSSSGTYGCYQDSGHSTPSHHWNRENIPQPAPPQLYGSNRPAPGPTPTMRAYKSMPHPYKGGSRSSMVGEPSSLVRQQNSSSSFNSRQNKYEATCGSESAQRNPTPHTSLSQMGQHSSHRPAIPIHPNSQQSRPLPPSMTPPRRPSTHAAQPQNKSWKFTNSFESQGSSSEGKISSNQPQTILPIQTQKKIFPRKPAIDTSLRILTAFIGGMRHWSQFKDKVPYLFEIFATLDSAVTQGRYGAKNFLMRDGKEAVQCVFYENELVLPRLIRGQVYRCVGNYDRSRDVLTCVSVRPGQTSELRNSQEVVKACDAEMRALVRSLSEV